MRHWLVLTVSFSLGCHPAAKPTPAGTVVIDWKETTTTLSTGVGIGAPVSAPVHEHHTLELTPGAETRDRSLRVARFELDIERSDVTLTPNALGNRPSAVAALPQQITIKVVDSGGWSVEAASCDPMLGPADIGEGDRRVGFGELCSLFMRGGREDTATVVVTVAGNGAHATNGAFGIVTLK
jgi:hypothetical protein